MAISPPAWGWPLYACIQAWDAEDFPTRVGMARNQIRQRQGNRRFPHPRGDGPGFLDRLATGGEISPPAWGWPDGGHALALAIDDFPTRVGMARVLAHVVEALSRFPHPRGDGPKP